MKRTLAFLKSNSLKVISVIALVAGMFAVSTASWFEGYQPECPKELLK